MVLRIIPREGWGAQEPRKQRRRDIPVENIAEDHWVPITINKYELWETCKTEEECAERCRLIQKMAFDKNWDDIQYSFLIGGDGNVYEGKGWHANVPEMWIWSGVRIGYIGRFTKENPPPDYMKQIFNELVEYGKKRLIIKEDAYIIDDHNRMSTNWEGEENPEQ